MTVRDDDDDTADPTWPCGACGADSGEECRPMCLARAELDRIREDRR